jgi:hypothetical protein
MTGERYGVLQQSPTNTHGHRMSSAEEAMLRMWDVDPEDLVSSLEASQLAEQTAARRERMRDMLVTGQRELGYVMAPSMMVE